MPKAKPRVLNLKPSKAVAKPVAKAAKPSKPVAAVKPAAKAEKPVQKQAKPVHNIAGTYTGPSPTFRGHGRKLSRVAIERFGTLLNEPTTDRDNAFLSDLRSTFGNKPFPRYDADAGNLRRAGERGFLKHVSGDPASRDCIFQLTEKALRKHG